MNKDFQLKTVALIGGSGGIGAELDSLLDGGYKILNLSSSDLNLTDVNSLKQFFSINDIDIVINLSGYNFDCFLHKYDSTNFHEIDKQLDVVVKGSIHLLNACLPAMRDRGFGRIIMASSVLVSQPSVGTAVYSASKAFVESLVQTCAIENCQKGITANAIQIGYFDAGLTHKIPDNVKEGILAGIPSKRWGAIVELKNVVEMLITTEYVNGTTIKINGGKAF
ncbi:SDR family oxidoreductase [Planktomarina sp.]|nr:SDR family oxidoreductase [Planktomarina sp.]MDA9100747.1 SDR family oxidoreductase [Planktomarina sp.]